MSKHSIIQLIKNVEIPNYLVNGKISYKKFNSFTYASYTNGTPCVIANMYFYSSNIINLKELSIKRVAYCLAHLIRYCENKNIQIAEFDSNNFVDLSNNLQNEIDENGKVRNNRTINDILKNILYFYEFVGKTIFNDNNYVKVILKADINQLNFSNNKSVGDNNTYYSHPALVANNPARTRNPISKENINKIYDNIANLYQSSFGQERLKVLLLLLETTGARIGEINNITVFDIEQAYSQDKPLLKLKTLKRKSNEFRHIPIDKNDLKKVIDFIKIQRKIRIKKTIGAENDAGFLFIGHTTGKHLNVTSLINDFGRLKKLAGINDELSAHMFRHRFITNMFIQLIKRYDFQNQDSFRNALLDVNTLKVYIQELTGHKSSKSLDTYLHLAKSELANMPEIVNQLDSYRNDEAKKRNQEELLQKLINKDISIEEYATQLKKYN